MPKQNDPEALRLFEEMWHLQGGWLEWEIFRGAYADDNGHLDDKARREMDRARHLWDTYGRCLPEVKAFCRTKLGYVQEGSMIAAE